MDINKSLDILNLKHGYTYIELKKSYHINALLFHPDKNSVDTTEKFKDINNAYKILNENLSNTSTKRINDENLNDENLNDENLNDEYLSLIYNFIVFLSKNNGSKNEEMLNKLNKAGESIIKKILDKLTLDIIEDIYLLIENNTSLITYIDECTKTMIINSIKTNNLFLIIRVSHHSY